MSEHKVAGRYAKALVDLYQATGKLEDACKDIRSFREVLKKNPALVNLLKSPIIHGDKKSAVMNAVFEKSFSKDVITFFNLIIKKKREYFLPAIADAFIDQYNDIKNIGTAEVRSAIALDAKTSDEIRSFVEKLTGKSIELTSAVEPALIGGVVIRTGDKLYDASISGNLQKVKQELLNTYISK